MSLPLGGCYIPTEGIRDANPGPTAAPPWPYDPAVYPPGRNFNPGQSPDAQGKQASPIPGSQTLPEATSGKPEYASPSALAADGATLPPPSGSIVPQYADWMIDGPEGRSFAYYLASGYRRYAKHEDNEHDFEDAAKFLFRASAVERGERVEPELLALRTLPAYSVNDLLYARQRLMAVLNLGAAHRFPKVSASTQVAFDCWMEQQEENIQPQDIAQCRSVFEANIYRLERALIQPVHVQLPQVPCPPESVKPSCDTTVLYVLFDFDKHDLTSNGKEVLQQAVDMARRADGVTLVVSAHADRSGADSYNDALSKRRMDVVIAALETAGISRDKLARADYFGETKPRVETPDGVRNQENRRVEIRLACNQPKPGSQR